MERLAVWTPPRASSVSLGIYLFCVQFPQLEKLNDPTLQSVLLKRVHVLITVERKTCCNKHYMSGFGVIITVFIRTVCNGVPNGPFPVTLEFMSQVTKDEDPQAFILSHGNKNP